MSKLTTIQRLHHLEDVLKGEHEQYRAEVCWAAANEIEAAEAENKRLRSERAYWATHQEKLNNTKTAQIKELEADCAEVNADLAAERRVNHTLQESLNTAEAKLKAIGELPVIDGNKLVEIFHGDYVSPDDFVSASELKALLEDKP